VLKSQSLEVFLFKVRSILLVIGEGFQGSNPQSCSARPPMADRGCLGGLYDTKNIAVDYSG
jgi:hypothetical protein